ncbi:MAG: molybdopterin-binding protein [Pseudorhodoplanes sp.]|nr:molybdopterin-binding protein [Pseudorhodoplanes sp.]
MTGPLQLPQRIARLAPLADVLAAIDAKVAPVGMREIATASAPGRVLAADAGVSSSMPAQATALRDGFAVRSDWTLDASSYAPALLPHLPARVDAGEALPADTDAVAPFDTVEIDGGRAQMTMTLSPGDGVLPAGADAETGRALCHAGDTLQATDIGVLIALGIAQVSVRAPRIRLTQAHDSAMISAGMHALAVAIEAAGGEVVRDDLGLERALQDIQADAAICVGGTGSGRRDRAVTTLAALGHVAFHGIGISPGETTAFGFAGNRPVLLLPARLDAALAGWLLVGLPLLARLSGATEPGSHARGLLSRKLSSAIGLAEAVLVRRDGERVEPLASGYWPLHALARADGWILVPASSEGCPAGTSVDVRPLP